MDAEQDSDAEEICAEPNEDSDALNDNNLQQNGSDDEESSKEDSPSIDASSDDDDDDDEQQDDGEVKHVDEEGRPLSEYEIQRLERIRRNREYLAQLGLEGKDGGGVLGGKKKEVRPKSKKTEEPIQKRHSLSRRSKVKKSYTEPSSSVRDLLEDSTKSEAKKRGSINLASVPPSETGTEPEPNKKKRKPDERMEKFIYDEFRRIKSEKTQTLALAERNVRAADKEVKYWKKLVDIEKRKAQRQLEAERQRQQEEQQRATLGGRSMKEMVQYIDSCLPKLQHAVKRYDDSLQAEEREYKQKIMRREAEEKVKTLDAIDRFPRAMKSAISLLNAALLDRSPKDPPPLRRSKRSSSGENDEDGDILLHDLKVSKIPENKASLIIDENAFIDDAVASQPLPKEDTANEEETSGTAKQRRKIVRNVGGWVSPDFAEEIDRSWLDNDSSAVDFNLSTYVPQIGDIVLYYISGHRAFLDEYPDILGKKTKSKTRIPLWERALQEKEIQPRHDIQTDENCITSTIVDPGLEILPKAPNYYWWNEQWLEGVQSSDLGNYPLLCRVEKTHAEFPPDPFCKVIKKDDNKDGAKVYFRKPKGFTGTMRTSMRLAVSLRPLTPLLPPVLGPSNGGSSSLSIPPSFTVVTFPCKLEPFLIPFTWAYTLTHTLSTNQKVVMREGREEKVRIDSFIGLESLPGLFRLSDKLPMIGHVLEDLDNECSTNLAIEQQLSEHRLELPLRETAVIIEFFRRLKSTDKVEESPSCIYSNISNFQLGNLIQYTLPIWKSASIMRNMYDRKKNKISPWYLVPAGRVREFSSPWVINDHVFSLEESLRVKLLCSLEDFVSQNSVCADLFLDPVTEDDAPSYFCAVPIGMSCSKILKRLKVKGTGRDNRCYYRSTESLLSDVTAILDCCLLYNSPDADVVRKAVTVVSTLKENLTLINQNHFRELKEARKADEERRRLVFHSGSRVVDDGSKTRLAALDTFRNPFGDPLDRTWLDQLDPMSTKEYGLDWIPQAGDSILYSRDLHSLFVKHHYQSFDPEQCYVPPLGTDCSNLEIEEEKSQSKVCWIPGKIVWTRTTFPRSSSKRSGDTNTFSTMSLVLAVGIRLQESEDVHVIYWRPCLFPRDVGGDSRCRSCGLSYNTSFLQVGQNFTNETALHKNDLGSFVPKSLTDDEIHSIERCFLLLKQRCSRDIAPAFIDPQLNKENVKTGFRLAVTKITKNSTPSYIHLFKDKSEDHERKNRKCTRGVKISSLKNLVEENISTPALVKSGFLPPWVSSEAGFVDQSQLHRFETALPSPKLCLELVLIRLQNGYYRHKAAVESDLVESYLNSVFMIIFDAATKKKAPISVRKVARALSVKKDASIANIIQNNEENDEFWVQRLLIVRELHAAAIVSVSDTVHVERIFALSSSEKSTLKQPTMQKEDPSRQMARRSIDNILAAFGKDELLNNFQRSSNDTNMPIVKVRVVSGNKVVAFRKEAKPLSAQFKGKDVSVKVVCEKEVIVFKKKSSKADPAQLVDTGHSTLKYKQSSILFGPENYESNTMLAKLFFGRPYRTGPCARCQAFRRSMLVCRVNKRHSNVDFDWLASLTGGASRIEELLLALHPDEAREQNEGNMEANMVSDDVDNSNETNAEKHGDSEVKIIDTGDDMGVAQGKIDPFERCEQAESLLTKSVVYLGEAKKYFDAPVRLSKTFITEVYPVDPVDGHYLYCIICGLSGDLLCCDGCANVVHSHCVQLTRLPDGDWFCEECCQKKKLSGRSDKSISPENMRPPFDRNEFDAKVVEKVAVELDELRMIRPTQKPKTTAAEDKPSMDEKLDLEENRLMTRGMKRNGLHDEPSAQKKRRVSMQKTRELSGTTKKRSRSDPMEVLSETTRRFLSSLKIFKASDFLLRRTTDLGDAFASWREAEGMPPLKSQGTIASVSAWKTQVRNKCNEMGIKDPKTFESQASTKRKKLNSTGSAELSSKPKRMINDPIDVLDALATKFLSSQGIDSASHLLSLKSVDIANAFSRWRKANGLPELRGSGPSAYVGTWKSAVRKKARMMGLKNVAEMQPDHLRTTARPSPKRVQSHKVASEESIGKTKNPNRKSLTASSNSIEKVSSEVLSVESASSVQRRSRSPRRSRAPPRFIDLNFNSA